jgi:hypothetical protein
MNRQLPRALRILILPVLALVVIGAATAVAVAWGGDEDASRTVGGPLPTGSGSSHTFAEPPDAAAAAGSVSVPMGTGTYCWTQPGVPGLCRDMQGPITGVRELQVQRGATVVVNTQFPGANIKTAVVSAYAVGTTQGKSEGPGELSWNFPPVNGQPLTSTTTARGLEFTAALNAGRYVVSVFLQVPEGDVVYGVVLDVR